MTDLSPAAQAIYDAWRTDQDGPWTRSERERLAAALRAAADQVVPKESRECQSFTNEAIRLNRMGTRSKLLAIAAELDGKSNE
jgi:hypothetical protein